MTETKYTYSVLADFPNQLVSAARLAQEIEDSAIVIALSYIGTIGDVCDIWFKDILGTADETILNALVAAHSGEPVPRGATIFTTEIETADGTPIIANRDLVLGQIAFKRTDDGTESLAVNGVPSGAATVLWNGTGAGDTGGDWTASGVGSETTASMHSGTNGWDTGVMAKDDQVIFSTTLPLHVEDFSQLSFWWQPKAMPTKSNPFIQWTDGSDSILGNKLNLEDYVTNFDLDVWQKITIPFTDFNFNPGDEVQKLKLQFPEVGQHVWLDDFEVQEEGGDGPFVFQVTPGKATERYHVSMMVIILSGASSGWNADTFANVSALSNGLLLRQRRISTAEVLWSINSRDNIDLFGRFHPQDDVTFADGTLLVGFMIKPSKASVVITDDDVLELVVRDNLSGLTTGRAFVHYGVEEVG